jgi:hypothetical protein
MQSLFPKVFFGVKGPFSFDLISQTLFNYMAKGIFTSNTNKFLNPELMTKYCSSLNNPNTINMQSTLFCVISSEID